MAVQTFHISPYGYLVERLQFPSDDLQALRQLQLTWKVARPTYIACFMSDGSLKRFVNYIFPDFNKGNHENLIHIGLHPIYSDRCRKRMAYTSRNVPMRSEAKRRDRVARGICHGHYGEA